MRTRHARLAVALALALVLALATTACGGSDSAAPPATTTTTTPTTSQTSRPPSTTGSTAPTTTAGTAGPTTTAASTTTVPSGPARLLSRGDASRRLVALTFDAGSDAGDAAVILDLLRAEGIRATFGVTGRWADLHPALVRRMAVEGHQLVNHSYDHPSFTGASTRTAPLSRSQRTTQLVRAEAAIAAAAGRGTDGWFRPPYGDRDASVDRDVAAAGYRVELLWTVDSLGWKGVPPAEVVKRCTDNAAPGAIVLLHVGAASSDAEALPALIGALRASGYGLATAAEILGARR